MRQVTLFWPGDGRSAPNERALPSIRRTTAQLDKCLRKLGRKPRVIEHVLSRPHDSIEKLGSLDEPLIGICVHWIFAPHTVDGVVGKDSPLLLASNFSGQWPGLVGLLNTGASLESVGRPHSRIWADADDWTLDEPFMDRLAEWCESGRVAWPTDEVCFHAPIAPAAARVAAQVAAGVRARRILTLMLGDTSMGMINGYFGPRLLCRHGFTEHKIDQAWLIDRGASIGEARIRDALRFVVDRGVEFHWDAPGAEDFSEAATREQLRDYLAVLDLVQEFKADCIGWQYQLGLINLRPPSDFAEGLLNSACRPESDGAPIVCATEADQGNVIPMELMKRVLRARKLHEAVFFHDVRWGGEHDGRFVWVLLNSGSSGAYAFNHDAASLRGVHSFRQPAMYFPKAGGTFAGESLPGKITWARAYITGGELTMDVGRGEVIALPPEKRDAWWNGTTREWPLMTADLGISRDTLMAHYMSNHVAVAYGDIFGEMVALSQELGFRVRILGKAA